MTVTQHSVQVDSIVSNIKAIYKNAERIIAAPSNKLKAMTLSDLLAAFEGSICRKYHDKRKLKASGFNEFFADLTSYGQLIILSETEGIDDKASLSKLFQPEIITADLADKINQALRNLEIPTAVCECYYCLLQNREAPSTSHTKLNTLLKKIHDAVCGDDAEITDNKSLTGTYIPATPSLQRSSTLRQEKGFIREIEETLNDTNEFLPIDEHSTDPLTDDVDNSAYIKVAIPKSTAKQKTQSPLETTQRDEKRSNIRRSFTIEKRTFFYAAASLIVGVGVGIFASGFSESSRNQLFEVLGVTRTNNQKTTPRISPSPKKEHSENLAQLRKLETPHKNKFELAKVKPTESILPEILNSPSKNSADTITRNTKKPKTSTVKLTAQITSDEEWNLTLASISRDLLAKGKLKSASRVAEFISKGISRFEVLGDIAMTYASTGKISTALARIESIKNDSRALSKQSDRVFILSRLSVNQYKIGKPARAQQTLKEAMGLANNIDSQPEKSTTLSHIAAAYAAIGSNDDSSSFYQQADDLLDKTPELLEHLSGKTAIALSYYRSGERNKAIKILHESLRTAETLSDSQQRTTLQAKIALALAKIGNANSALITAQNINSTSIRNNTLYQIVVEHISTGQLHAAKLTVEHLELPEYQAKAYSLLARFQKGTRFSSYANLNFSTAVERGRAVLDPSIKATLLSEIARHYMRNKKQSAAEELMEESLSLAHKIDDPMIRDRALASIAKNQARAYLLTMAERTVDSIGNRPIALESLKDIQRVRRIIYALHAINTPLNI